MDCFLSLPTDLACSVLLHWLCLKSVASLDSAYFNVAKRRVLLETVFQSPQLVMNDPGLDSFEWILIRCIRVRCLTVTDSSDIVACKDYLSQFGECVQEIIFDHCDETKLAAIMYCAASHCKFARRLQFYRCDIDDRFLRLIPNFKVLDELNIDSCRNLLEPHNSLLSELLTDKASGGFVKSMTFMYTSDLVHNALYRYICGIEKLFKTVSGSIPSYPSLIGLKVLHLNYVFTGPQRLTDTDMIQVVHHCPMIVHLHLEHFSNLTDLSGVVIAKDLHRLRTLLVDYCGFTNLTMLSLATYRTGTLEILSTIGCYDITSEGYSAVLQRCHKLHTVQLSTRNVLNYNYGWNNVTHMKMRCFSAASSSTFVNIMRNSCKLQGLELSYSLYDKLDFTVLSRTVPQLRVLKLFRSAIWRCDEREVEQRDKQDALLRDIGAARPELKAEFIDYETNIDVMKLPVLVKY